MGGFARAGQRPTARPVSPARIGGGALWRVPSGVRVMATSDRPTLIPLAADLLLLTLTTLARSSVIGTVFLG